MRDARRSPIAGVGIDRHHPACGKLELIVEPRTFALQGEAHGFEIVDQRDLPRPVAGFDRAGPRRQPAQAAQQEFACVGSPCMSRWVGHRYLIDETRVSNILFTVVITCDAAE
jgi:hypothetical protein